MLGLYTEWKFAPFRADDSFGYLVSHAWELKPITQGMIMLGAFFAYWLGKDAGIRLLPGGPKRAAAFERQDHSALD
jgi:hypothetical protein